MHQNTEQGINSLSNKQLEDVIAEQYGYNCTVHKAQSTSFTIDGNLIDKDDDLYSELEMAIDAVGCEFYAQTILEDKARFENARFNALEESIYNFLISDEMCIESESALQIVVKKDYIYIAGRSKMDVLAQFLERSGQRLPAYLELDEDQTWENFTESGDGGIYIMKESANDVQILVL